MKHGEVRGRLGPYLEGDLPLQQRALVDAHLDACPSCAEELTELRGTIGLLRSLPDVEPPPGLARSVVARIREGEAQSTRWVRILDGLDALLRSRSLVLVASAAGMVALALLAPGWFAVQTKAPQVLPTAVTDASDAALATRLAPLNIWTVWAPFVHWPAGASVPDEPRATPVALAPEPLPVAPELAAMEPEMEEVLHHPRAFLDELSLMPSEEREEVLSTLADEAVHEGRTEEVVETLRTTGDSRAEVVIARVETLAPRR
jgi:hypothetical protein